MVRHVDTVIYVDMAVYVDMVIYVGRFGWICRYGYICICVSCEWTPMIKIRLPSFGICR